MKCPSCRYNNDDAAQFCVKCGLPLENIKVEEEKKRKAKEAAEAARKAAAGSGSGSSGSGSGAHSGGAGSSGSGSSGSGASGKPGMKFAWKKTYTFILVAVVLLIVLVSVVKNVVKKAGNGGKAQNDMSLEELLGNEGSDYDASDDIDVFTSDDLETTGEVDRYIESVKAQYSDILDGIHEGRYTEVDCSGFTGYFGEGYFKAIVVPKNTDGVEEARLFYYDDNGELIFAHYTSDRDDRMIFSKTSMLQWRTASDPAGTKDVVVYEAGDGPDYDAFAQRVLDDSFNYLGKASVAYGIGDATGGYDAEYEVESDDPDMFDPNDPAEQMVHGDYMLEGSDSRYVSLEELEGFTADQCRIARNELYARHGRLFTDEGLQSYFNSKSWYSGSISADSFREDMLNDYEVYNRDLIVSYEEKMGYR